MQGEEDRGGVGDKKKYLLFIFFFLPGLDLLEINQFIGRLINWADSLAP